MIIYKDILSGDEIISDTYDLKDIDNVVFEVDCKMVSKGGKLEINIGANAVDPNAAKDKEDGEKEETAEPLEEKVETVNDIIDGFRLVQMPPFSGKKDFAASLNEYTRHLTTKLKKEYQYDDDKVKSIKDGINGYARKMVNTKKIHDYEPYVGETMADKAMPIYLNYRPDGSTPFFTIWKHGLTEMKV